MADYEHDGVDGAAVKIWVSAKIIARRWWFGTKTVYYVNTEFLSQGPYETFDEAIEQINLLKWAESQALVSTGQA